MLKQSAVYLGSSLISKSISFLLLPILTRYLSPDEYGTIVLFQLYLALYQSCLGLNLNMHVTRARYVLALHNFQSYLSSMFVVLLTMLCIGLAISALGHKLLGDFLSLGDTWLYTLPFIACMSMSNQIFLTLLRAQNKAFRYAAWEIFSAILNVSLSLFLITTLKMGWEGRAAGISLPLLIVGALSIIILLRRGTLRPTSVTIRDIKEIFGTSIPLIPHAVAGVAIKLSDRYFVGTLLGESSLGIYSVAMQFGMVLALTSESYTKAWQPYFFKHMADDSSANRLKIARHTALYLAGITVFAFLYWLIAYSIFPWLIGRGYASSRSLLAPAILVYLPYCAYQMAFLYLVLLKKTNVLAVTSTISAFLSIGLNYFLIAKFGLTGGFAAIFIAYLFNFIIVLSISHKYINMPWLKIAK